MTDVLTASARVRSRFVFRVSTRDRVPSGAYTSGERIRGCSTDANPPLLAVRPETLSRGSSPFRGRTATSAAEDPAFGPRSAVLSVALVRIMRA